MGSSKGIPRNTIKQEKERQYYNADNKSGANIRMVSDFFKMAVLRIRKVDMGTISEQTSKLLHHLPLPTDESHGKKMRERMKKRNTNNNHETWSWQKKLKGERMTTPKKGSESSQKLHLLTCSNNKCTTSASLCTSAAQRQDKAQPAEGHFLTPAVKVWH